MTTSPTSEARLDSWKAIAQYLKRDVATARRWEKLGLPVRRVPGGRGTSVFAYPSEIDQWLADGGTRRTADPPVFVAETTPSPQPKQAAVENDKPAAAVEAEKPVAPVAPKPEVQRKKINDLPVGTLD